MNNDLKQIMMDMYEIFYSVKIRQIDAKSYKHIYMASIIFPD